MCRSCVPFQIATTSPTLTFRHVTPSCIRHVHQQPTPLATSHPPTPSHVTPHPPDTPRFVMHHSRVPFQTTTSSQPSPSTTLHPPASATSTNNLPHLPRHPPPPQAMSPPTHLTRVASSCTALLYPSKPP
ncbi:unnamed protein product [Closterium sp. NIES-54]